MLNSLLPYLKPHLVYTGLSVAVFLLTIILPDDVDATVYHIDFKDVFIHFQYWRLVTCLLIAGQFLKGINFNTYNSLLDQPSVFFQRFLPYLILQSGILHLGLCYWHLKRMYKYAVATKNGRELYLSLGYVVLMIWGIKYISGSFFEAAAYERLQQDKYSSFDGLFSILTSILKEASFMRQLQYNIGIFPSYFMFTMAIVTLSSYRNHKEVLQYPLIQLQYWALPLILTALQFILTINSPLRTALLVNNLVGFAIGRSYKAFTEYEPIKHKLNRTLGTHLD